MLCFGCDLFISVQRTPRHPYECLLINVGVTRFAWAPKRLTFFLVSFSTAASGGLLVYITVSGYGNYCHITYNDSHYNRSGEGSHLGYDARKMIWTAMGLSC